MVWNIVLNILLFYGILIAVNIPAPFIGLEFESGKVPRLWYAPPGYVIPIIWFILFALLGLARFDLIQRDQNEYQWWLLSLAILCATYAYYTLGLAKLTGISALWFGLAGNLIVILFSAFVAYNLYQVSKTTAYLTIPVTAWTAYASLIVLGEIKREKLF